MAETQSQVEVPEHDPSEFQRYMENNPEAMEHVSSLLTKLYN